MWGWGGSTGGDAHLIRLDAVVGDEDLPYRWMPWKVDEELPCHSPPGSGPGLLDAVVGDEGSLLDVVVGDEELPGLLVGD
jgi:hypothetical protein